jgi:hypothetical protein
MQFPKNLLDYPIRNTILFLGISLAAYLVFASVSLYLTRVLCAASFDDTGSCHGTNLQMLTSMVLNDFELIFRITTELSIIALIAQCIYRLSMHKSK